MSTEILTPEDVTTLTPEFLSSSTTMTTVLGEFSTTEDVNNTSLADKQQFLSESQVTSTVFEAFIIIEIVMTAFELILSILAASKVARWRRNYRNQMLMQLSLVRFLKRTYNLVEFLKNENILSNSEQLSNVLLSVQVYVDFVVVILVCFFINHMYDSLIIVLVKVSKNQLVKVISCAWLIPVPLSAVGTSVVLSGVLTYWWFYLFICAVFRWPLMLIGTMVYFTILINVLYDKIRRFARSLTIITFLLCFVINLHLFLKDIIWLWCYDSFLTLLVSYLLGFLMNILILCLYIILITLHWKYQKTLKSSDSFENPEHITRF